MAAETRFNKEYKMSDTMWIINKKHGYSIYEGKDEHGEAFYNAVPSGSTAPKGGYYSLGYILDIKGIKWDI